MCSFWATTSTIRGLADREGPEASEFQTSGNLRRLFGQMVVTEPSQTRDNPKLCLIRSSPHTYSQAFPLLS